MQAYVEASNTSSTWVDSIASGFSEASVPDPGRARKQSQMSCCCALCARSHRPADMEERRKDRKTRRGNACKKDSLLAVVCEEHDASGGGLLPQNALLRT